MVVSQITKSCKQKPWKNGNIHKQFAKQLIWNAWNFVFITKTISSKTGGKIVDQDIKACNIALQVFMA